VNKPHAEPQADGQGLSFPCGAPPAPAEAREVLPGLMWLRMPLPFALDHINLWALREGEGWAVVDTGAQTPATLASWGRLLAPDGALGGRPLTRVLATHLHPDHMGMAGWLTRKFDCRLWMTRQEYLMCRTLVADTGHTAPDDAIRFYRRCGWSEIALDAYRVRFGEFGKVMHRLPDSYRRIVDGERIAIGAHQWRVVVGRGHSPEHACLVCDEQQVMISGDQVLPGISSNVSVFPTEPDADPLAEMRLPWDAPRLRFAVREPFPSRHSQADLVYGEITAAAPLRLVSLMPEGGVIFSDGIESDFLAFGAGTTATIEVAAKQGRLVV